MKRDFIGISIPLFPRPGEGGAHSKLGVVGVFERHLHACAIQCLRHHEEGLILGGYGRTHRALHGLISPRDGEIFLGRLHIRPCGSAYIIRALKLQAIQLDGLHDAVGQVVSRHELHRRKGMIECQWNGLQLRLIGSDSRHHVHLLLHVVGNDVMERGGTVLVCARDGQALRVGGMRIPGVEVQRLYARPVEFLFGIPIGSAVLWASFRCRHAIHEVGRTRLIRIGRHGEGLHNAVVRLVGVGHLRTARHRLAVAGETLGHFGSEVDGLPVHLALHLDGFKLLRGRSGSRMRAVSLRKRLPAGSAHGEAQAVVALARA